MQPYLDLLAASSTRASSSATGPASARCSLFGHQMRFDLAEGFPLLTTKKLHLRSILIELLWFLRGDTNIGWLKENKVSIWDEWADEAGDLGPVYGKQWRRWQAPDGREIDQIANLIELIRRDPGSRRQIVSAWNPGEIGAMALPPCHLPVPDLCRERPAQPPALPAQRRRLPRRPVQHRQLRAPDPHARPAMRPRARRLRLDRRRLPPLFQPSRPGPRAAVAAIPARCPSSPCCRRPTDIGGYAFEDFEISRLRPPPPHQGRGGGLARRHSLGIQLPTTIVV